MSDSTISKDPIMIERIFDAPVDLIWQMWTQPEHLKNWYGPEGFTISVAEMDVRVGGKRLVCMETQTPDGSMKIWTTGEYTEVVPNKRLVYTDSPADENGNVVSPSAYGMNDEHPLTTEVTVLLEDLDGRTKMVLRHAGLPANEQGASQGWTQAFTKLADHIATVASPAPSECEFVMERIFAAPRDLVFQAFSDCKHLKHWWGPKHWTLPVCQMDFRPGGVWLYCMRGPDGMESWGKAVYREIVAPERIVYVDAFVDETGTPIEGTPEMLITVSFEDLGGKTKLATHTQFPSAEDLKAVLGMGMVEGVTQTWDRLEAYLASV